MKDSAEFLREIPRNLSPKNFEETNLKKLKDSAEFRGIFLQKLKNSAEFRRIFLQKLKDFAEFRGKTLEYVGIRWNTLEKFNVFRGNPRNLLIFRRKIPRNSAELWSAMKRFVPSKTKKNDQRKSKRGYFFNLNNLNHVLQISTLVPECRLVLLGMLRWWRLLYFW